MNQFDAIVIGAGPGGTTIASLLANQGKRVLLVDKNDRAGGRMSTFTKDGFSYELFPLNGVPSTNSLFEELSRTLGRQDAVKPILAKDFGHLGSIYYEDKQGTVHSWAMGASPLKLLRAFGVRLTDFRALKQTIGMLSQLARMPVGEIETLQEISALAYIDQNWPLPAGIRTYFLATFAEGVFEMSADRVPAAEMIRAYQATVKDGGGRYYARGIGGFFEEMAKTVEERGGRFLKNTRVKRILIEEERAVGIETTDGEEYRAPLVISSAGVRQTALKLVGEAHFPADYIEKLKELENNLACVGYRYFVDAPVLKDVMMIYYPEGCVGSVEEFARMARGEQKPEHNYIYIGTTSLYPGMAPEGKQLIYACMSCLADPAQDAKPYLDYIERRVRALVPELYDHIERVEVMEPKTVLLVGNDVITKGQGGESYGIAMSLGQCGADRPRAKSPIEGLYYVGNDVEGTGLGTHMAVESGFKVFEMLKNA
ncbi:MAG: NAD(P)/FAD-dependent oxidoreductase [Christensenella sp.]|nr:NAD(P)/FAD-dependent oxidoreductase [Christensenella sp.]